MLKKMICVLAVVLAFPAVAAPKAESATECGIAADMAIVARSLAEEAIQLPRAHAIMARIYDVSASARGKELMGDILDAAYRTEGESSQKFAESLFTACIKTGGNMDTILGKRL
jgi:hypothetical protein